MLTMWPMCSRIRYCSVRAARRAGIRPSDTALVIPAFSKGLRRSHSCAAGVSATVTGGSWRKSPAITVCPRPAPATSMARAALVMLASSRTGLAGARWAPQPRERRREGKLHGVALPGVETVQLFNRQSSVCGRDAAPLR